MDTRDDEIAKVELLLEESRAARYRSALDMVRLAEHARDRALALGEEADRHQVADVRARAFAELANAYRLADQLDRSDEAIGAAFRHYVSGSKDPMLLALLADRLSSLLCHRRRFPEALGLLDILIAFYRSAGEEHLAGRALVKQGLYASYSEDTARAIVLTLEGLRLIDGLKEPAILLSALHNLLDFASRLEYHDVVRRLLPRIRPLHGDNRLSLLRLRWIEGRAAPSAEESERVLREVRNGFLREGLIFPASLVSLDLALVLTRLGRPGDVAELATELIASFRALRVGPEAMAALILLRRAAQGHGAAERIEERVRAARQAIRTIAGSWG